MDQTKKYSYQIHRQKRVPKLENKNPEETLNKSELNPDEILKKSELNPDAKIFIPSATLQNNLIQHYPLKSICDPEFSNLENRRYEFCGTRPKNDTEGTNTKLIAKEQKLKKTVSFRENKNTVIRKKFSSFRYKEEIKSNSDISTTDNTYAWVKNREKEKIKQDKKGLKFIEINDDLFNVSKEYSLAHCVGADLKMGKGIALEFKKQFKRVDELLACKPKIGNVLYLDNEQRYIFYLVTKKISYDLPHENDVIKTIKNLKDKCIELNIKKLAMPRLSSGLDKLSWTHMKNNIQDIFHDMDIEIRVYFKL